MSPGSNTESYPAFAHIGLRENPGKTSTSLTQWNQYRARPVYEKFLLSGPTLRPTLMIRQRGHWVSMRFCPVMGGSFEFQPEYPTPLRISSVLFQSRSFTSLPLDNSDFQQTTVYMCSRDANIGKRNETNVRNVTTDVLNVKNVSIGAVTRLVCLGMVRISCLYAIRALYGNERYYFEQDGAPSHYHRDVRTYLDETVPVQDYVGLDTFYGVMKTLFYEKLSTILQDVRDLLVDLVSVDRTKYNLSTVGGRQDADNRDEWRYIVNEAKKLLGFEMP
ncbi:hypothetical protein ANN_14490 [Periplaneta americana]|uniref:Uncharacterized protein n=1 Tax=Periplaneta americana TaxID=6978 RepID=A0ABQ8SXP8_PERAM|nr:hypothetical protein ANN_14490 [Periplaneta americana]